ncbi:MAG TPA: hypothetical protein PLZ15_04440 [Melioribacteraceae bacterium]|nr:hypothetical protein [Melioribacteraceae bacterium]
MKRLIILILAIIIILLFSSIALGQKGKSRQIKNEPQTKENMILKIKIERTVQQLVLNESRNEKPR